jgi:hypothetical protein
MDNIPSRGFASMAPEKRRQVSSQGGKAAHAKGVARQWTLEEAREFGRKGGLMSGRHERKQPRTSSSASG